jgi:hypothetical protein
MLDIAKIAQDEEEKGINNTIIHRIMDITEHTRCKLLVKWERDNRYIDAEAEERHKITPHIRYTLLQEIDEEEKKEKENQISGWNILKIGGKVLTAGVAAGVSIGSKQEKSTTAIVITAAVAGVTILIDILEVVVKKCKKSYSKYNEEIKIPPLRNTDSRSPKNHTKVDLYSL